MTTSVHMVSLGCSRNDVDSEELAARMEAEGFQLTTDPAGADVIMVNTCGFIEQAKKEDEEEEVPQKKKRSLVNAMRDGIITKEQYNKYLKDGYSKNTPIDV